MRSYEAIPQHPSYFRTMTRVIPQRRSTTRSVVILTEKAERVRNAARKHQAASCRIYRCFVKPLLRKRRCNGCFNSRQMHKATCETFSPVTLRASKLALPDDLCDFPAKHPPPIPHFILPFKRLASPPSLSECWQGVHWHFSCRYSMSLPKKKQKNNTIYTKAQY